jgi:RNA polymerase sigma-70 factor (sigma-E family)
VRLDDSQQRDFDAFVLARTPALLRTAHLLTGDRGHAEDLLQTAFERLARQWRIDRDPEAYVRRSLVNLSTDRWRRRSVRPTEVGDRYLDTPTTADRHGQMEDRLDLVEAMRSLTPRQRAVLVLRYFDDLSEQDTARLLDCSVGTIKSTTSRALAVLRERTGATDSSTAIRSYSSTRTPPPRRQTCSRGCTPGPRAVGSGGGRRRAPRGGGAGRRAARAARPDTGGDVRERP